MEAIAAALHRSPAAFLVDSDEAAAIVEQIASNQERCLQVLFFLETLAEQAEMGMVRAIRRQAELEPYMEC